MKRSVFTLLIGLLSWGFGRCFGRRLIFCSSRWGLMRRLAATSKSF